MNETERVLKAYQGPTDSEDSTTFLFGENSTQHVTDSASADLCDLSDVLEIHDQEEFWIDFKLSHVNQDKTSKSKNTQQLTNAVNSESLREMNVDAYQNVNDEGNPCQLPVCQISTFP